jgi:hypothetical protein
MTVRSLAIFEVTSAPACFDSVANAWDVSSVVASTALFSASTDLLNST